MLEVKICDGATFQQLGNLPEGGVDGHLTNKDRFCSDGDLDAIHNLIGQQLELVYIADEHLIYNCPSGIDSSINEGEMGWLIRLPRISLSAAYERDCKLWNCCALYPEHTAKIKMGVLQCTLPQTDKAAVVVEMLVILQQDGVFPADPPTQLEISTSSLKDRISTKQQTFNIERAIAVSFDDFVRWMNDGSWMQDESNQPKLFYPA